jgi:hypothetical protein
LILLIQTFCVFIFHCKINHGGWGLVWLSVA